MRVFPTAWGILSVAQDTTERKKAQSAEALYLQKLESLFNIAGLLTKPQPLSLKCRQILDELTRVTLVEFASQRILDEDTQQLRLLAFPAPTEWNLRRIYSHCNLHPAWPCRRADSRLRVPYHPKLAPASHPRPTPALYAPYRLSARDLWE